MESRFTDQSLIASVFSALALPSTWAGSVTKATFSGYSDNADLELHNNKHTVQFTVASGTAPTFKSAGLAALVGRVNNATVDTVADPIVWTMEQVHFHWGKLHDCMVCLFVPPHASEYSARSFIVHLSPPVTPARTCDTFV
jgi:hypothetical protein